MKITSEEAHKLLDGTTPGPWETSVEHRLDLGCDHIWIAPASWNPRVARVVLYDGHVAEETANAALLGAAPDLARTVIALHAELAQARAIINGKTFTVDEAQEMVAQARADAKAAVAVVVEKVVEMDQHVGGRSGDTEFYYVDGPIARKVRALAPEDAIAEVDRLRAEIERLERSLDASRKTQETYRVACNNNLAMQRAATAELAAANAREEGLREILQDAGALRDAADRVSEWFCTEARHLEGSCIQAMRAAMVAYDRHMQPAALDQPSTGDAK